MTGSYQLVQLANGAFSVRSVADGETFHPVIGPVAEAQALYIRQLGLIERLRQAPDEFVVWDVGLGAAANPLTLIASAAQVPARLRIVSFDHTAEPLRFALRHAGPLGYLEVWREQAAALLEDGRIAFQTEGGLRVHWEAHFRDFPELLRSPEAASLPKPHAIFYDAYSPLKNPAMWTLPVFSRLFELLDPDRPCVMPTYSRSTLLRVTLLLAGFFVGAGGATGEKEETTLAASRADLITVPLDARWLARARRSRSAEPLRSALYRQAPLEPDTLGKLLAHPQFRC